MPRLRVVYRSLAIDCLQLGLRNAVAPKPLARESLCVDVDDRFVNALHMKLGANRRQAADQPCRGVEGPGTA